jgi:protein-disulfide isomerase
LAQPDAAAPQQPEEQPLTDEQWQEVLASPVYAEGDENAKVTLVEFTDYQCPFCKRHFDETEGQIETDYVKTGKVRWVIHDLPLSFHQNAHAAAEAARCAGDQDKYRQMHDQLFETQATWSTVTDPAKTFSGYAKTLGLNTATFDQCFTSGKYKQAVDDDLALATKIGASGTPTFYVNGQPIVGAQPFASFKAAIDSAL